MRAPQMQWNRVCPGSLHGHLLALAVALAPALLGWTAGQVARLAIPAGRSVLASALEAVALAAVPWWCLFTVPWALFVAVRTRRWAGPLLVAAGGVVSSGIPVAGASPAGGVQVLVANVDAYSSEGPEGIARAIADLDPAVAVLLEKRPERIPGMVRVADNFDDDLPRISHGAAVFCRIGFACRARVTAEFGSSTARMPLALVRFPVGGKSVCLAGIHAPPPVPKDATGNLPYVRKVAGMMRDGRLVTDAAPCRSGDPVVVAGDLNQVPGSHAYRTLRAAGLSDALAGRGVWAASWPAGGNWPDFPFFQLDHVLPGAVEVAHVRQLRLPGSDHEASLFGVLR